MAEQNAFVAKHGIRRRLAGARLAVVKRAKAVVLLPIVAALLASAIVALIPNRYGATVLIQIDPRLQPDTPSDGEAATPTPPAFEAERLSVEQQVAILESPSLVDHVVESLHLAHDPEFQTRPLAARIMALFEKIVPENITRDALAAHLSIERVRNSSLVSVRATSREAAKAAAIANAVAAEYIAQVRSVAAQQAASGRSPATPTASEKVFASLLDQYGLARTVAVARIVEDAHAAARPEGPKRTRIIMTTAVSTLLLMLALAVMLERDAQLRTRNVEQMLACPHMTSLPSVSHDDVSPTSARRARLIIAEPGCRYAEAVRAACDELSARASGDGSRVILVASALPGEGAEAFASNIAHHLAVAGQKTLLIDCDLHAKSLTRQLAPQSSAGLFDQIARHAPIENVILRDNLTGVHFLPASGTAPVQLSVPAALRSVEFTAAFQRLKARFQTIVVSAPPLLEADDGRALAEIADQIVFLTAWHRTPRALAKKALTLLEANQRKVVGAVLADIADDRDAGLMSFAAMFEEVRRATRLPMLDRAA
jgi:Mrp family chromosome partitioning ATPase